MNNALQKHRSWIKVTEMYKFVSAYPFVSGAGVNVTPLGFSSTSPVSLAIS